MSKTENPYEAPETEPSHAVTGPTEYRDVPLFRRNGFCSFVIGLHLLIIALAILLPIVLGVKSGAAFLPVLAIISTITGIGVIAVCIFVLTGPIFYNRKLHTGELDQWSWSNKIAAVIILVVFLFGTVSTLMAAFG